MSLTQHEKLTLPIRNVIINSMRFHRGDMLEKRCAKRTVIVGQRKIFRHWKNTAGREQIARSDYDSFIYFIS